MKKEKDGLRFTHLEIENFKSIEKKIIQIDGRSLLITGKNSAGKSSLIQALLSGLDSKSQPSTPIKLGETKASTKVKISGSLHGEPREYTIEMYYSPKNSKGRIVVRDEKEEVVSSPKSILNTIIGDISFNIFDFLKSSKAKQIKVLKQLSGVEKEIDMLEVERKKKYDDRTYLNKKVDESAAVLNNHEFSQDEIDLYSERIELEPIQDELANISKKITDYNNIKTKTENFKNKHQECESEIDKNNQEITKLSDKISELREENKELLQNMISCSDNHTKGINWLEKNAEPSVTEISERLNSATSHNEKHTKIGELAKKHKALILDKEALEGLNDSIKSIDKERNNLIKNSKLPIKGLNFSEDEIYYNNLPLEAEQINTQTLIDIGFEISMALNPNLRVIFLNEGSLFDQASLNALVKKCEDRGYQLIAEIVNDNPDLEVVFTEETPE